MPLDLMRLSRSIGLPIPARKSVGPIPLEAVPGEIIEHILTFCSRRDLLALSSTCWRFEAIANATLYRFVKPDNSTKSHGFLHSIYHRPSLGLLVRRCELELTFGMMSDEASRARSPISLHIEKDLSKHVHKLKPKRSGLFREGNRNPLEVATSALKKMPNLWHLELIFPEREIQTNYCAQLLGGCTFHLRHFHTNLRFDLAMAKFLQTQDDLRDLRLQTSVPFSSLDMRALKDGMLPRVDSLGWSNRVPMELVRHLVKGRSIHTVNISLPVGASDISDWLAIGSDASLLVRTANLTFRDQRHPIYTQLQVASIHFPNLTGFGIAVVALNQDIMQDLYKVIKAFQQLERLFIYDQIHDSGLTRDSIIHYARSFWLRCGTLRKIGFYVCDPYLMVEKAYTSTGRTKTILWVVKP